MASCSDKLNGKFVSKTNILAGAGIPCNIMHKYLRARQSCGYGMAATGVEFNAADHAVQSFRRRRRLRTWVRLTVPLRMVIMYVTKLIIIINHGMGSSCIRTTGQEVRASRKGRF